MCDQKSLNQEYLRPLEIKALQALFIQPTSWGASGDTF